MLSTDPLSSVLEFDPESRLYSWQLRLARRDPDRIELGLERIDHLARRLGLHPQHGRPQVLTIAGTNGKGSSAQLAATLLSAQGLNVGVYSSPHLHSLTERFEINNHPISAQTLVAVFEWLSQQAGQQALTYFEFLTLAAFVLFTQSDLDVWILEVGLGGRLDAVNSIDADAALITNIGLDHQSWLGETREQIGREKAGILRRGQTAVYNDPSPVATIIRQAELMGTALSVRGRDYYLQSDGERPRFYGFGCEIVLPRFQQAAGLLQENATGVLALCCDPRTPWQVSQALVDQAWAQLDLPGRQQWRFDQNRRVLLDVGHNREAVVQLAKILDQSPAINPHTGLPKQRWFLFAAMSDKPLVEMLSPIAHFADHWVLAGLDQPRAASVKQLSDAVLQHSSVPIDHETGVDNAYNRIIKLSQPGDEIVVFGSFFTVGPVLARLDKK